MVGVSLFVDILNLLDHPNGVTNYCNYSLSTPLVPRIPKNISHNGFQWHKFHQDIQNPPKLQTKQYLTHNRSRGPNSAILKPLCYCNVSILRDFCFLCDTQFCILIGHTFKPYHSHVTRVKRAWWTVRPGCPKMPKNPVGTTFFSDALFRCYTCAHDWHTLLATFRSAQIKNWY